MRDDFSGRAGATGDGYIDVGVKNLDLEIEETAIDNATDNNDIDETKIPRGNSIFSSISIINRGIEEDWTSPCHKYDKPEWMNKNFVPCACKECFFCTKEITSRMFGSEKKKRRNFAKIWFSQGFVSHDRNRLSLIRHLPNKIKALNFYMMSRPGALMIVYFSNKHHLLDLIFS